MAHYLAQGLTRVAFLGNNRLPEKKYRRTSHLMESRVVGYPANSSDPTLGIIFLRMKTADGRICNVAALHAVFLGSRTQESPVGLTLMSNTGDGYNGQVY